MITRLKKDGENKSKVQHLIQGQEQDYQRRRKPYMDKMNRKQVSTIFKARTRMLDAKNNFRGKYSDLLCRGCGQASETQKHILEECPTLHPDNLTKVTEENIFNEEIESLKKVCNKIIRIENKLSQSEVRPPTNQDRDAQLGDPSIHLT